LDTEAEDFFSFLTEVCHGPDRGLQIMYGIGGETQLDERTLEHLDGYEHSLPVRGRQRGLRPGQHDVWGLVVDSVYLHTKSTHELPGSLWPLTLEGRDTRVRNRAWRWSHVALCRVRS